MHCSVVIVKHPGRVHYSFFFPTIHAQLVGRFFICLIQYYFAVMILNAQ